MWTKPTFREREFSLVGSEVSAIRPNTHIRWVGVGSNEIVGGGSYLHWAGRLRRTALVTITTCAERFMGLPAAVGAPVRLCD